MSAAARFEPLTSGWRGKCLNHCATSLGRDTISKAIVHAAIWQRILLKKDSLIFWLRSKIVIKNKNLFLKLLIDTKQTDFKNIKSQRERECVCVCLRQCGWNCVNEKEKCACVWEEMGMPVCVCVCVTIWESVSDCRGCWVCVC